MFGELKVMETFERKSDLHPWRTQLSLVRLTIVAQKTLEPLVIRLSSYLSCTWRLSVFFWSIYSSPCSGKRNTRLERSEMRALALVTFSTVCKATLIVSGSFNDIHWYMNIYLDPHCHRHSLFLRTYGDQCSISSLDVASRTGYKRCIRTISCGWNTVTICVHHDKFLPHRHDVVCILGKTVDKEVVLRIQNWEDASADEAYYNYLKEGKTTAVEVDLEEKRTWATGSWKDRM